MRLKELKAAGGCILLFLLVVLLSAGVMIAAAQVPRSQIREHMEQSAELLCQREVFFRLSEAVKSSTIDRYADSILLSIAWHLDEEDGLKSVLRTAYSTNLDRNENENLLETLRRDLPANQQYIRYWHGSAAIVRVFHRFGNLRAMYRFHAVLLTVLLLCLLGILLRHRLFMEAAGLVLSLVMVGVWYVPLSLEYTWTFLLMAVVSIVGVELTLREKDSRLGALFLVSGMLTSFLDFLTTETLTLLVPLLLVLRIQSGRQGKGVDRRRALTACILWATGYVGMWLSKWLLASVVLGENVMPYVWEHIGERVGGALNQSLPAMLAGAVTRNLGCLFPLGYGIIGGWAAALLTLAALYVAYVYHRKPEQPQNLPVYLALGALPYLRYLVLRNHSWLHCFFTYRAQMATVLAVWFLLWETTWLSGKKGRDTG